MIDTHNTGERTVSKGLKRNLVVINDLDMVEIIDSFLAGRKRFRRFTSLKTLMSDLNLSETRARRFIMVAINLGLGTRQNRTLYQEAGINWNEHQVRPMLHSKRTLAA